MRRCRAASISCARPLAGMRSRPSRRPRSTRGGTDPPDHDAGAFLGRMDLVRLAGLPDYRDGSPAPDGGGADLCPALCVVHRWSALPARTISTRRIFRKQKQRPLAKAMRPQARGLSRDRDRRGKKLGRPGPRRRPRVGPTSQSAHHERFWRPRSRRRCGSSCWSTSFEYNPQTKPRTGPVRIAAKNTLIDADADAVEARFRERLASLEVASGPDEEPRSALTEGGDLWLTKPVRTPEDGASLDPITLPAVEGPHPRRVAEKTIRLRDKEHCKFVASQPCIVCGRIPPKPITFASLSRAPSAVGSVMSTQCPSAVSITAICTAMATSLRGGLESTLIQCLLHLSCGENRV